MGPIIWTKTSVWAVNLDIGRLGEAVPQGLQNLKKTPIIWVVVLVVHISTFFGRRFVHYEFCWTSVGDDWS